MDDQERVAANKVKIANIALPVLLAREGGSLTVTEREFDEVVARYGGAANMTIRMVRVDAPEPGVRVTLVRKTPGQGELPV